ncbi:MAG TPA: 3-oxoacyl-[acyl-carrier-protein] synthase III C-terminal domain-containing protein [Candidatus Krumholzibacteria bacterium]
MKAPAIVAVATATPGFVTTQAQARTFATGHFADLLRDEPRLLDVFENAGIETRHSCVPAEWVMAERSFAQRNARYVEEATALGSDVARRALERARLGAGDIDHVVYISSTGIATPSIDALIANRIGLRDDTRRTPVWGLGCAGGAAGLSRARDFALAAPRSRVLVIALELCSLTFLPNDRSKRNLVAMSLFADGAAAVVVEGAEVERNGAGPRASRALSMRASHSTLWKDTVDVMGWDLEEAGLRVVFSRSIPHIVVERVRPGLDAFLAAQGMTLDAIRHIVAHPGGTRVLAAYERALELGPGALAHARDVLRGFGNMSSPSCLFVLERFLDAGDIGEGDHAMVMALGPGFSAEYVLVRGEA